MNYCILAHATLFTIRVYKVKCLLGKICNAIEVMRLELLMLLMLSSSVASTPWCEWNKVYV